MFYAQVNAKQGQDIHIKFVYAGYLAGIEGPMIYIGGVVGAGISQVGT